MAIVGLLAQSSPREDLDARAEILGAAAGQERIAALESAARDRATAAEAHEALGTSLHLQRLAAGKRVPGWHDEPSFRAKALAELRAVRRRRSRARVSAGGAADGGGVRCGRSVDPAPPRPEIRALDAKITARRMCRTLLAAIEQRAAAQADPSPFFAGAQALIDRGEYDRAWRWPSGAGRLRSVHRREPERVSADGKSQGSYARGRATAADLVGWRSSSRRTTPEPADKLMEAARLSQTRIF
jgi:hypothetical protein